MKAVARIIGWILILAGAIAIVVIVWAVASGRVNGNFLVALMLSAPVILIMIFGGYLARAGRRRPETTSNAPVWTRRGPV